jgi:hypothetical protein
MRAGRELIDVRTKVGGGRGYQGYGTFLEPCFLRFDSFRASEPPGGTRLIGEFNIHEGWSRYIRFIRCPVLLYRDGHNAAAWMTC